MLRITQSSSTRPATLKVEGKLTKACADEVARACAPHLSAAGTVVLDFSSVTFIDANAAATIRDLMGQQVRLRGCSPLIARLLKEPSP